MLWLLLIMGSATAFSTNYPKVFGDDWTSGSLSMSIMQRGNLFLRSLA